MSRHAPGAEGPSTRAERTEPSLSSGPSATPERGPYATPGAAVWERLGDVLAGGRTRDRICEEVCRIVVDEFGFARALIATLDREGERLVTRAGYDPSIGLHVARALRRLFTSPLAPRADGRVLTAAWCVLEGEQVHVPDASAYDFRPLDTVQRSTLVQVFGVKEYVLTPIRGPEGAIGLLAADKKGREEGIGPEDLGLLRAVARLTGLALGTPGGRAPPARAMEAERTGRRDRPDQVRQMQAVLDALHEGLLVLDEDGTVKYLNRAALSLLAVLPWEAVGKPWGKVLPLAEPEGFARLLDERPAFLPDRMRCWTLDSPAVGSLVVEVEILPLASIRGGKGTALFLKDVTDRAEEQRVREEFVSMLVHDLNMPVQGVLGFAELLLMGRAGPLNETQRDFIARIAASGQLMTHLVGDILRLGDLESGKALFEREGLDPFALVQGVLDQLDGLTRDTSVALVNQVPRDLPPLSGDRIRLLEALQNVVTNAIEASEPGTAVRVRGELLPRENDPWLRLQVVDEGVGLDEEGAAHLFDKYRSFGRGKRLGRRALGLGLAIARLVVEAHGGEIRAASAQGRGTIVTIDLPLGRESP